MSGRRAYPDSRRWCLRRSARGGTSRAPVEAPSTRRRPRPGRSLAPRPAAPPGGTSRRRAAGRSTSCSARATSTRPPRRHARRPAHPRAARGRSPTSRRSARRTASAPRATTTATSSSTAAPWCGWSPRPSRSASAPKTWWFPIVGRVPYLGWFDRDEAHDFADELRERGLGRRRRRRRRLLDAGLVRRSGALDHDLGRRRGDGRARQRHPPRVGARDALRRRPDPLQREPGRVRRGQAHDDLPRRALRARLARGGGLRRRRAPRARSAAPQMHRAYEELAKLYASDAPREREARGEGARSSRRSGGRRTSTGPSTTRRSPPSRTTTPATPRARRRCSPPAAGAWRGSSRRSSRSKKEGAFTSPNQADLGPVLLPLVKAGCPAGERRGRVTLTRSGEPAS